MPPHWLCPTSRISATSLALCLALVWPRPARAASFAWSAPESCPTAEVVRERVETELELELGNLPEIAFQAQATMAGKGYELRLAARKNEAVYERRVLASTCDELVDVLVAAMSLAIESLAPRPVDPEADSAGADGDETASGPIPAPRRREPRPNPGRREKGGPAAPGRPPSFGGWANVDALLDVGALPGPAIGAETGVAVGTRSYASRLSLALLPAQRFGLTGTAQGDFSLLFAHARFCHTPAWAPWRLLACIGGEIGRLSGEGVRVTNPRHGSATWVAVGPELGVLLRPSQPAWGVSAWVGLPVPLARQPFELTELGTVHTPARVGVRAGVGLDVTLW